MESLQTQYVITKTLEKTRDLQGRKVYNNKYVVDKEIESNSLASIKLAHLVDNPSTQFAIKTFSKVTLKSKKEYVRRADGKGMEIHT